MLTKNDIEETFKKLELFDSASKKRFKNLSKLGSREKKKKYVTFDDVRTYSEYKETEKSAKLE